MSEKNKYIALIIDDDIDTVSMLNDMLSQAEFTTLVALDGIQAIQITQQLIPHIILIDGIMPKMNGFETCQKLRQNPLLARVPIIFMTGLNGTEHVLHAFDNGVVDYIIKPIKHDELLARIRTHLHNSQLTFSAINALDIIGQATFTLNLQGEILWATPQAIKLLQPLLNVPNQLTLDFKQIIIPWLKKAEYRYSLLYQRNFPPLRFFYLEKNNWHEFLLSIEIEQQDEVIRLKKFFNITHREAEVILCLSKGKTNTEAAQILELSARTINKHLEHIYKKMDVDNRILAAQKVINFLNQKS